MSSVFENKKILVSGAGPGIGHAICQSFAASGGSIIAVARDKSNLAHLQSLITGSTHQFWSIDLSTPSGQQELLEKLQDTGLPSIVVNNMHIPSAKNKLMHSSMEALTTDLSINIDHLYKIMPPVLRKQRHEKFGRWIGISSMSAHTGIPGNAKYNMQKTLMETLFTNLATEEGKFGITANIVAPGFILTPRIQQTFSPAMIEKISSENIMKRAGTAEEVAAAVHFLASPMASYITGIVLPVCGGAQLAWSF